MAFDPNKTVNYVAQNLGSGGVGEWISYPYNNGKPLSLTTIGNFNGATLQIETAHKDAPTEISTLLNASDNAIQMTSKQTFFIKLTTSHLFRVSVSGGTSPNISVLATLDS